MFGAFGIVIGPVLMIVIVTTISVYLAVYKGVPMETHDDEKSSPKKKRRLRRLTRKARRAEPEAPRTGRRRVREGLDS